MNGSNFFNNVNNGNNFNGFNRMNIFNTGNKYYLTPEWQYAIMRAYDGNGVEKIISDSN